MAEKVLIIYFLVYYQEYIKIKGILVFMTIFTYLLIQRVAQPYQYMKFNTIDYLSSLICSLTIILAVFLNENKFNYFIYLAYLAIIVINMAFIVFLMYHILRSLLVDKQLEV